MVSREDALRAVSLSETADEAFVLRPVQALKVVPGGIVSDNLPIREMPQLDFAHAEVNRWQLARRRPSGPQCPAERDVAVADHGVEDHVRLGFANSSYHPGNFGARRQQIFLPGDLATKCRELLPNDGVGRARVDGIPSQQEELADAQGVECPADGREHLLIGGSAGVDDVRGLFEALILHGVNKQMIVSLEDGEEFLSAGGGPATEQGADLLLGDQPLGFARMSAHPTGHRK